MEPVCVEELGRGFFVFLRVFGVLDVVWYFVMSLVGYFEFEWMTFYFENFGRRLNEL